MLVVIVVIVVVVAVVVVVVEAAVIVIAIVIVICYCCYTVSIVVWLVNKADRCSTHSHIFFIHSMFTAALNTMYTPIYRIMQRNSVRGCAFKPGEGK